MTTNAPDSSAYAKALLDAANSASEKVAALHIAFLALCTYVVVIVFSTTDLDLLIGKGIKLPVVDVEVPIVGFYAAVPYLLVLVHFHLLLQLQLLSRKLYTLNSAVSSLAGTDRPYVLSSFYADKYYQPVTSNQLSVKGLEDRLNIFPFNYYLIGRPSRLVAFFIALLVTITILLLPLGALLTLQARFLAYQNSAVTWAQRTATWLDVGVIVVMWPIIMDARDSWRAFMNRVWQSVRQHPVRWAWGFAGFAIAVLSLAIELEPYDEFGPYETKNLLNLTLLPAWLFLTAFTPLWQRCLRWLLGTHSLGDPRVKPVVSGLTGLLATILLGLPLPLLLQVDGETIDRPKSRAAQLLDRVRHLDLHEKVLLGKSALPVTPATIADLRSEDPATSAVAERSIERIDLQDRSLRGANFFSTLMPKADLRESQLQGADLSGAHLQGADLSEAQLQGADLSGAHLQGAILSKAQLQGATLLETQLQGADLSEARLEGANLSGAHLQGAILSEAQLQGADFWLAQLQGADLSEARLEGAILKGAELQSSDLSGARLQGATLSEAQLQGADLRDVWIYTGTMPTAKSVDVRGLKWEPLSAKRAQDLQTWQSGWRWWSEEASDYFSKAIKEATTVNLERPTIGACVRDSKTGIACKNSYDIQKFREFLSMELEKLFCESPYIAHGILGRADPKPRLPERESNLIGFALRLQNLNLRKIGVSANSCPGLFLLSGEDKARLNRLAQTDTALNAQKSPISTQVFGFQSSREQKKRSKSKH